MPSVVNYLWLSIEALPSGGLSEWKFVPMKTTLNLLTREGLVYVSFRPALTAPQYAELLDLVERGTSAEEMREAIRQWADLEQLEVDFEE